MAQQCTYHTLFIVNQIFITIIYYTYEVLIKFAGLLNAYNEYNTNIELSKYYFNFTNFLLFFWLLKCYYN